MSRLILALALLVAPLPALAQEPACEHDEVMSCADGTMWDTEAGACVPITTS